MPQFTTKNKLKAAGAGKDSLGCGIIRRKMGRNVLRTPGTDGPLVVEEKPSSAAAAATEIRYA